MADGRSIVKVGHSRHISIPPDFIPNEKKVIERYTEKVLVVTPASQDDKMILTGEIFKELDKIKSSLLQERKYLLNIKYLLEQLEHVSGELKEEIEKRIEELNKKIRLLRTPSGMES